MYFICIVAPISAWDLRKVPKQKLLNLFMYLHTFRKVSGSSEESVNTPRTQYTKHTYTLLWNRFSSRAWYLILSKLKAIFFCKFKEVGMCLLIKRWMKILFRNVKMGVICKHKVLHYCDFGRVQNDAKIFEDVGKNGWTW